MNKKKLDPDQLEKLSEIFQILFNRPDLELSGDIAAKDIPEWD